MFAVVGFDGTIGRSEGIALILVYSVYLVALLQAERSGRREPEPQRRRALWDFMTVAIGMAAVIVSAHLVVTRAISIAQLWGVSQTVIGIFLVGAGTSLPELALSVRAATKGQSSISVGNIIGSNTFDMLVPIGASAAIFPLAVSDSTLAFDIPVIGLITIATLIFFLHRKGLQKSEAAALLLIYMAYALMRLFAF